MRYNNIGDAIAGMIDQTKRGMTDHEYELHIKRLYRYAYKIDDLELKIEVLSDEAGSDRYKKAQRDLEKYKAKLKAEKVLGLK